jgi:hypothetical protein
MGDSGGNGPRDGKGNCENEGGEHHLGMGWNGVRSVRMGRREDLKVN